MENIRQISRHENLPGLSDTKSGLYPPLPSPPLHSPDPNPFGEMSVGSFTRTADGNRANEYNRECPIY